MVAAFTVLRLVVDDAVLNFYLANAEIALEIRRIVLRVPEAKLDGRKHRKFGCLLPMVRNCQLPDLKILVERHEEAGAGLDPAVLRGDCGVTHSMPAGIVLQLVACGLPGRRPELARGVVSQINVPSAEI